METTIQWIDLGRTDYSYALRVQEEYHAKCVSNESSLGFVVKTEHDEIITLGKTTPLDFNKESLNGIRIIKTDRGGQATAHMPGQLILYPILKIMNLGLYPKNYVRLLETAIIELLKIYEIPAHTDEKYPGVWVGEEKICAIGIRLKDHVTMHGLALNVSNTFDLYQKIIPCGINNRGTTSISKLLSRNVDLDEVYQNLKPIFLNLFEKT